MTATYSSEFRDHSALIPLVEEQCTASLNRLAERCANSISRGGKLLLFGNGGSAADAQHIAAEFVVRLVGDRRALPAIALTTDSSILTACANDLGFDRIFSRQIEAFGRPNDVAIGISTSGNSRNVVSALRLAASLGMTAAGFTGGDGGDLAGLADPLVIIPSTVTARIQEMHILLAHILCADVEKRLGSL